MVHLHHAKAFAVAVAEAAFVTDPDKAGIAGHGEGTKVGEDFCAFVVDKFIDAVSSDVIGIERHGE